MYHTIPKLSPPQGVGLLDYTVPNPLQPKLSPPPGGGLNFGTQRYFIRTKSLFEFSEKPPNGRIFPTIHADIPVILVDQRIGHPLKKQNVLSYMPSLMKSNLQKAIRRKYIEEAFVTAKHLLYQDPNELLRRLPIIMCEDTQLHAQLFIEIVWLMAAVSKGYALTHEDAQIIIDFVGACLAAPYKYNLHPVLQTSKNIQSPLSIAFMLRISYGGMESDSAFMTRLRTRLDELPQNTDIHPASFNDIPEFDQERHLLREAIDFHAFPKMIEETGVSKAAIWFNRAALNYRTYVGLGAKEAETYDILKRDEFPIQDETAIDDFVDIILARLHGHVKKPKMKQTRLVLFSIEREKKTHPVP